MKILSTYSLPDLKFPGSSSIKPSVTLRTLSAGIRSYIFSNHALHTNVSKINTFSLLFSIFVEWKSHSRLPAFRHNTILKGHITQPPNLVHHHFTSTYYNLFNDLILTCSLSVLTFPHSHLFFSSFKLLSSEMVTSLNTLKTPHVSCILFLGIHIMYSRSSKIIFLLLVLTSHFHL